MSRVSVPGLVLAGGRSSRMGRPKALLPAGSETFVGRIARILRAGGAGPLVVVAPGADLAARIGAALAGHEPPPRVVVNPDPARGQLSSLVVGLDAIDRPGVDAAAGHAGRRPAGRCRHGPGAPRPLPAHPRPHRPAGPPGRPRPRPPGRLRTHPVRRAPPRRPRIRRQARRPRPRSRGGGRRRRRPGRLHRHRHPGRLPPRVRRPAAPAPLIRGLALRTMELRVGQWRSWERA